LAGGAFIGAAAAAASLRLIPHGRSPNFFERAGIKDLNELSEEMIAFLTMMIASKPASEDLKAVMAHVRHLNAAKAAQRREMTEMQREMEKMQDTGIKTCPYCGQPMP
jgi:hypothetical protein